MCIPLNKLIKLLFLIKILFFLSIVFSISTFANDSKPCFITTAYYSPIKWQKYYYNWSYYKEIKMNWEGHTTSSGKKPYYGTLAWSKNYPFWTKIYFEWYGVWVIEDRWWDIVKKWVRWDDCDRIDIWMGYGDEWLWRALKWWKNVKLYWKIVWGSNPISLKFGKDIMDWYKDLKVNPEYNKPGRVNKLQTLFKNLWLYKWKIDWKYTSIKKTLIDFQLKNKLISSKYDDAAWRYWPKTVTKLIKLYWTTPILKEKSKPNLIPLNEKVKTILAYSEVYLNWDNPEEKDVRKVQELFKYLWLYTWKIDWKFTSLKPEFIKFQKVLGLIKHDKSWGAWYYWNTTKKAILEYFDTKYSKKQIVTIKDNWLNIKDKKNLEKAWNKLAIYLKNKSKWNKHIEKVLRNNFIKKIDNLSKKTKNILNKKRLKYLKNLITINYNQDKF